MDYNQFWFLVEGPDDARFIRSVISPFLHQSESLNHVKTIEYSQWPKKKLRGLIRSLLSMEALFLLLADNDSRPCLLDTREKILNDYDLLKAESTIVVVQEIEGWYIAGHRPQDMPDLKLGKIPDANVLTKEGFNQIVPRSFNSRIDFLAEVLNHYSLEVGCQNNSSLAYFVSKLSAVMRSQAGGAAS